MRNYSIHRLSASNHQSFLGRKYFSQLTQMWTFRDGSGPVSEEMRQDQNYNLLVQGLAALVARNYHQREKGGKPDRWYWADVLLLKLGYVVMLSNPRDNIYA